MMPAESADAPRSNARRPPSFLSLSLFAFFLCFSFSFHRCGMEDLPREWVGSGEKEVLRARLSLQRRTRMDWLLALCVCVSLSPAVFARLVCLVRPSSRVPPCPISLGAGNAHTHTHKAAAHCFRSNTALHRVLLALSLYFLSRPSPPPPLFSPLSPPGLGVIGVRYLGA